MRQDENCHSRFELTQIDIVVTIIGRDELERLDVAMSRSTSYKLLHATASTAGCAADTGVRFNTVKHGNKMEIGPDTVKPVSHELGGRQGTTRRSSSTLGDESGGSEEWRDERSYSAQG